MFPTRLKARIAARRTSATGSPKAAVSSLIASEASEPMSLRARAAATRTAGSVSLSAAANGLTAPRAKVRVLYCAICRSQPIRPRASAARARKTGSESFNPAMSGGMADRSPIPPSAAAASPRRSGSASSAINRGIAGFAASPKNPRALSVFTRVWRSGAPSCSSNAETAGEPIARRAAS